MTSTLTASALLVTALAAAPRSQELIVTTDTNAVLGFGACNGAPSGVANPPGLGGLSQARGVRVGVDGDLYVASLGTDEVLRYDAATGAFVGTFVAAGLGGLVNPWALAFSDDGHLFVTSGLSTNAGAVLHYDASGALVGQFAQIPTTTSSVSLRGLAWAPNGHLFVSDAHSKRVHELDANGGQVAIYPLPLPALPSGLVIGPTGDLFVADTWGNRVLRIDLPSGTISTFVATGLGGLNGPQDLLFGPAGNLLVASAGTQEVKEYDGETGSFVGDLVTSLSGPPVGLDVRWPRRVSVYGQSTPGAQRPCTGVVSEPVLGNPAFAFTCRDLPANQPGVLVVGFMPSSLPLPIQGAGLWVNLPLLGTIPTTSSVTGDATVPLVIPNQPVYEGVTLYTQWLFLDPQASGGVCASRALEVQWEAPCAAEPTEPNDHCPSAAPITPGSLLARLCPAGDEDWYELVLTQARDVTIQLAPPTAPCVDYDCELYESCGSLIGSSSSAGCAMESLNAGTLCAGSYRIRVFSRNNAWSHAPYSLNVIASQPQPLVVPIVSPAPVAFNGPACPLFAVHPALQYSFTPECNETVDVAVTGTALQMAACLQQWLTVRIRSNGIVLDQQIFTQPSSPGVISLAGSFNAAAGVNQFVDMVVCFNCFISVPVAQIPPANGSLTMTITRTPQ